MASGKLKCALPECRHPEHEHTPDMGCGHTEFSGPDDETGTETQCGCLAFQRPPHRCANCEHRLVDHNPTTGRCMRTTGQFGKQCGCFGFQKPDEEKAAAIQVEIGALNKCLNCGHGWAAHNFNDDGTAFTGCSVDHNPDTGSTKWCVCGVFRSEYGGPDIPNVGDPSKIDLDR